MTEPVINDRDDSSSSGPVPLPEAKQQQPKGPSAPTGDDPGSGDPGSGDPGSGEGENKPRRRRGSRGGRGRSRSGSGGAKASTGGSSDEPAADEPAADGLAADAGAERNPDGPRRPPKQTERGSESDKTPDELPERANEGRPKSAEAADRALVRKPKIGDTRPAPASESEPPEPAEAKAKPRRRRGSRGRSGGGAGGPDGGGNGRGGSSTPVKPVEAILGGDPLELDDEQLEKRRGRHRKGRPVGRYLMVVSVREGATQMAVLEGRNLIEHYVSRPADDVSQIHGNVYLGKVQNVLPGMEAAFVDIGTPKNAVLYRGDVQYDAEDIEEKSTARIEQILKAKQNIVCQVTKNPIAHKGARLTQEVSLPGRFVVLIPNSKTYGISKRLPDDERRRLRQILDRAKPAEHGIIVRTAAEGVTAEEIEADVRRLLDQWSRIDALAKTAKSPNLLYREPDMAVRVIREEFSEDYRGIVIDNRELYEDIRGYVGSISPALADRVQFYDKENEPLSVFERHHVHEQLHKALDRKVWLPSGGSLIIEHTEALTVIDVNTGKNVGSSSLEETVYRNNLEAAVEIAKQLRLRDIGGIIVCDFIDMEIRDNRDEVIKTFRDALARDKTRTQVFDISELGLVEMTRKRIGEGLLESFSSLCPECEGRGLLIDQGLLD
jgi:ribonuclease E